VGEGEDGGYDGYPASPGGFLEESYAGGGGEGGAEEDGSFGEVPEEGHGEVVLVPIVVPGAEVMGVVPASEPGMAEPAVTHPGVGEGQSCEAGDGDESGVDDPGYGDGVKAAGEVAEKSW